MIVSWKKISALEFVARWESKDFQLLWSPVEHRWQVYVDGARTNKRWISATAAMDSVETSLCALLKKLSGEVQAVQRPSSREHIVVHHGATVVDQVAPELHQRKRSPFRRSIGGSNAASLCN